MLLKINKYPAVEDGSSVYVTELQEPLSQSPQDRTFFARLDAQLNKVNRFYKKKEAENIARAGALEKQLVYLINSQEVLAREGLDYDYRYMTMASSSNSGNNGDRIQSKRNNVFMFILD